MASAKTDNIAFISVGSNIAPEMNTCTALTLLQQEVLVLASSTFYQTDPIGPAGQPPFINGVWLISSPNDALTIQDQILHPIETRLGRERSSKKYAPRPMDLDLILSANEMCENDNYTPHPDIERGFVSEPIREILTSPPPCLSHSLQEQFLNYLPNKPEQLIGMSPLHDLTQKLQNQL